MNLFELKDGRVTFAPQALVIKEFAALWKRDRSQNKTKAVRELSYIYYMTDYRSDVADIVDEETRDQQVREMLQIKADWKPDAKIEEARERYRMLQDSLALQSLRAAYVAADKLNQHMLDVDLAEMDKNGKPIWKAADVDKMIASVRLRVKELREAEEEVKKAIEAKVENQGSIERALFEDW